MASMASMVSGATYFVRTDGNNSNSGTGNTAQDAWLTIQKAATTMIAGDTVTVNAGSYAEDVGSRNNGTLASPIVFQAAGGVVNVSSFKLTNSYLVIRGFTFNASNNVNSALVQGVGGVGNIGSAHNVALRSNTFNTFTIAQTHILAYGTNWLIDSNLFLNTYGASLELAGNAHTITNSFFSCTNGADLFRVLGDNHRFVGNLVTNWSGHTLTNGEPLKAGLLYSFASTNANNGIPSDFSNVGASAWPYTLGETYGGSGGFTATGTTPNVWGGTRLNTANHPDIVQSSSAYGYPSSSNLLFAANMVIDCPPDAGNAHWASTQFGNVDDGNAFTIWGWTFRNNLLVRISNTMNLYAPGFSFHNNTVYQCGTNSSAWVIYNAHAFGTSSNLTFLNNIVAACGWSTNASGGWYGGSVTSNQVFDYNLIVGTGPGTTKSGGTFAVGESHSLNGISPLFVDASQNNYRLQFSSQAVGAGTNLGAYFTTDADGNARISAWDIGAYEYQNPGTTNLVRTIRRRGGLY